MDFLRLLVLKDCLFMQQAALFIRFMSLESLWIIQLLIMNY